MFYLYFNIKPVGYDEGWRRVLVLQLGGHHGPLLSSRVIGDDEPRFTEPTLRAAPGLRLDVTLVAVERVAVDHS